MVNKAKTGIVYLVTNTFNGKLYVGQTVQGIPVRWRKHISHSKEHNSRPDKAIRKYGAECFVVSPILEDMPREELDLYESKLIILYQSNANEVGYNLTGGGTGRNGPLSKETVSRMSKSLTGRKLSEEHKLNIGKASVVRWADVSYKRKVSRAIGRGKKGVALSHEHRQSLSRCKTGVKLSESTKNKISESIKIRWQDRRASCL